ncbi:hypothetical protein SKAU_G00065970 [Synaphobranchus kaupii]|uniref:Uncharacterized protein n=1 Tax=Synaphobranchus kaupii TaxID=118154 RepID=A0A9Q1G6W4_SYNKA|nr:hypothetical protein SKAU_G00065970 [Synaphobranchus kaupii]
MSALSRNGEKLMTVGPLARKAASCDLSIRLGSLWSAIAGTYAVQLASAKSAGETSWAPGKRPSGTS